MTATGITFFRLVQRLGWDEALDFLQECKHPSRIWEWLLNLQKFIFQESEKGLGYDSRS